MVKLQDGKELKLSLSMVVKDEVEDLRRALTSVAPYVDEIVVGWNGTNPETEKVLQEFKADYFKQEWIDDHGAVRQQCLEKCTGDLVMWIDADDEVMHADKLLGILGMAFSNPNCGEIWWRYHYDHDKDGNVTMQLWRERVVRRVHYHWESPFHESLHPDRDFEKTLDENIYIKHHATTERIAMSQIRCLQIGKKRYDQEHAPGGKVDAKTVFDFGRALMSTGQYPSARVILEEYINLSGWDDERYDAYNFLADIYRREREYGEALNANLLAIKIRPMWPDAYLGMAQTFYSQSMWDECITYIDLMSKLKPPVGHRPIDPMKYEAFPLRMLHWALFQKSEVEKAIQIVNLAIHHYPSDKTLKDFRREYEKCSQEFRLLNALVETKSYLEATGEMDKLKPFVQAIPGKMADHPVFVRLKNELFPTTPKNRIVIFCGSSYEKWSPTSLADGIGGSEEAVIHLAEGLAQRGWLVDVYNDCNQPGEFAGVNYHQFWEMDQNVPCDIFIAWRTPMWINHAPKQCGQKYLWLHDVVQGDWFRPDHIKAMNGVFVLSRFHAEIVQKALNIPILVRPIDMVGDGGEVLGEGTPELTFYITANGIPTHQFNRDVPRNPNHCIYMSSPDRGLDVVLWNWKRIKEACPDATLDVYYGFTINYDEVHKQDSRFKQFKEEMIELMKQPGVTYKGRKSHEEIAQACLSSGLWLYPCHFPEISCISAMKAQAGGIIPVVVDYGALAETVQHGEKVHGWSLDQAVQDAWADKAIELLKVPGKQDEIREPMRQWALKTFDWSHVVEQWHQLFKTHSQVEA